MLPYLESNIMVLGLTEAQKLENFRLRFELAHNRNKELASYIRITDGAIWGFLGFSIIELFKDGPNFSSYRVPFFLLLLIFLMYLWRTTVGRYQENILDGYSAIKSYEEELQIYDKHSLTVKQEKFMKNNQFIDEQHLKLDRFATIFSMGSFTALMVWIIVNLQIYLLFL